MTVVCDPVRTQLHKRLVALGLMVSSINRYGKQCAIYRRVALSAEPSSDLPFASSVNKDPLFYAHPFTETIGGDSSH